MKLRPLFVLADLEGGGAQRVMLTVIRHLDRQYFEPHLGVINNTGPLAKDIPPNINLHNLNVQKVRYALPKIIGLCRLIKPEVVVSTLVHLNLALLAGRFLLPAKSRLIVREANTPSIRLRYTKCPPLYRLLYRMLYPSADRIICNSFYMKRDLVDHFGISPGKIEVIANPVDTQKYNNVKQIFPSPYQTGKRHLVAVGRLHYQKGFDMLLKAVRTASKKVSNLHLTIIGEGPEDGALKGLAERLQIENIVTFTGHLDNPLPYMAHAELAVSPSRWEGLPNVVLEALACGTPVIAFDCPGGTREIVKEGENGWLVAAGDWVRLGNRIVGLLSHGERLRKVDSRTHLPAEFSIQNVVRRYEMLLGGEVHR